MTRRARGEELTSKTSPDWFYQSCVVGDNVSQRLVMYFTVEAETDILLSVHTQDRLTGARETVPVRAFFERFHPVEQEDWAAPPMMVPKREAEHLDLT